MESPFDVLCIDRDADDETVERAYRERVKEAHPDQGGSVEEFRRVRAAYERIIAGEEPEEPAAVAETGPTRRRARTEVTYLNYDVLADHGWAVDDDTLFEKAAAADLDTEDYGRFYAEPGESLLEAAENRGFAWPFACRGGACVNCAILLHEGELSMPVNHVLPTEMMERNIRLSCNGMPITDELKVVYNVKHMADLEELLLPPKPFEAAYAGD
ncbi:MULTISPECIES: ferredoxin Fer [Salinibaculum]|uniref:ferredoxin Fer n=1 Tax=Salinibaculum TaxID=2732368 RepID=UPI0030D5A3D0